MTEAEILARFALRDEHCEQCHDDAAQGQVMSRLFLDSEWRSVCCLVASRVEVQIAQQQHAPVVEHHG